jgi:hypothetical protein
MYAVVFHAHQKIDRVAYNHLGRITHLSSLKPTIRQIIHFEGKNGPDATKLKYGEGVEPPWHFMNPFDVTDVALPKIVTYHYDELVKSLKSEDFTRAAFEMAWLAHALVDGLTPAHHYPYEEELEEILGEDRTSRKSFAGHLTVKGETALQSVGRSLKLIGPKGLLTTHTAFEAGVYSMMIPMRIGRALPKKNEIQSVREMGVTAYFQQTAREVGAFGLYESFYKTGWTPKLGRIVRRELVPRMVKMVTLAWYCALVEAGVASEEES